MDNRSGDCSPEREEFLSEEQSLRETVRELAEENLSIRRDIYSVCRKMSDVKDRVKTLELKLGRVSNWLQEIILENGSLIFELSCIGEQCNESATTSESLKTSYKDVHHDVEGLQNILSKLLVTFGEENITLPRLRQSYESESPVKIMGMPDTLIEGELPGEKRSTIVREMESINAEIVSLKEFSSLKNRVSRLEQELEESRKENAERMEMLRIISREGDRPLEEFRQSAQAKTFRQYEMEDKRSEIRQLTELLIKENNYPICWTAWHANCFRSSFL